MVSAAESIAARIKRESARNLVSVRPGLVKSTSWVLGQPVTVITVDGVDFTNLPISGEISLVPGMTVNTLKLAGQLVVIGSGSTDVFPLQGTVSATGTGTCQVQLPYSSGVRTVAAAWLTHYTPAVGDVVKVEWTYGTPLVVGKLSQALPSSLTPPYVPTPAPTTPTSGVTTFQASGSGTVRGAVFTPGGLSASAGSEGVWTYGTVIADTLVGKVFDTSAKVQIYLPSGRAPASFEAFFELSAAGARFPLIHAGEGWYTTTTTTDMWLGVIKTGVRFAGADVYFDGIDRNRMAGALRIPWKNA